MIRPPFPQVLDSTIISSFRACRQQAYRTYLQHYKPKLNSVHLHAGGAFAHGLEVARLAFFRDGIPEEEAIGMGIAALLKFYGDFECPSDSAKSAERMSMALAYYFDAYPMQSDTAVPIKLPSGKIGVEFSFAHPIDINHPETGDPILYVGRLDQIVHYAGGIYGEDDKTTSSLGPTWAKQWDMRSQFTGYCWGAQQSGLRLNGFLIRGVAILKTKFDTQQSITNRPQWMIDRWYEQLLRDTKSMIQCWESGVWDYNLDASCESYGGCLLKPVCLAANPDPWLKMNFIRRKWDPVERTEIELPEDQDATPYTA